MIQDSTPTPSSSDAEQVTFNEDLSELDNQKRKKKRHLLLWLVTPLALIVFLCLFSSRIYRYCYYCNDNLMLSKIVIDTKDNALLEKMVGNQLVSSHIICGETHLPAIEVRPLCNALLSNPRIKSVCIRKIYPDQLHIDVMPRISIATLTYSVKLGKKITLRLDDEGVIVPNDLAGATKDLPLLVLSANDARDFELGKPTTSKSILAFLEFNRLITTRTDGAYYHPSQYNFDEKNERMFIHLHAQRPFREGAMMIMPYDDLSGNLDRVKMVVDERFDLQETIQKIDGSFKNIPVVP